MRNEELSNVGRGAIASGAHMSARLAREVRRRRGELRLSQQALARRGGFSVATLSVIERGRPRNYTPPVLAALDKALDWGAGHAQSILEDEAAAAAPPDPPLTDGEMMVLLAEYRDALIDLRETPIWHREAIALLSALSDQRRALIMQLARELSS